MNIFFKSPALCLLLLATAAAVAAADLPADQDYRLPKCDAPVASVAVGTFTCSAMNCKPMGGLSALASLTSMMGAPKQADYSVMANNVPAQLGATLKQTGCFDLKNETENPDYTISGDFSKIAISSKTVFFKKTESTELTISAKVLKRSTGQQLDAKEFVSNSEQSSVSVTSGRITVGNDSTNSQLNGAEVVVKDILARIASFSSNRLVADRQSASPPASSN